MAHNGDVRRTGRVPAYANPAAAYGTVTAPLPPLATILNPNCSVPGEEAVLAEPIAAIVFAPEVSVAPCIVITYPLVAFVEAVNVWASTSEAEPVVVLANLAADESKVPKLMALVEILKVKV